MSILYTIFLTFSGSALIATLFLYLRQSILLAYIATGIIVGPEVLGLVQDVSLTNDVARVGIIFLLFLLGISLNPKEMFPLVKQATRVTILSSIAIFIVGLILLNHLGFNLQDSTIIALALTSSSTILGLKLLPAYELHHARMADVIVSILLIQDILAIFMLLTLGGLESSGLPLLYIKTLILAPLFAIAAYYVSTKVLTLLIAKFDTIPEYLTILSIGWCIAIAQLYGYFNMSYEIGAFIAGVTLAANPVARHIAETLKPTRDFFLVLFFFGIGATLNVSDMISLLPAIIYLTVVMLCLKYIVFHYLLENENRSREIALRIGQVSEFSLLLGTVALGTGLISTQANTFLQGCVIVSFILSSTLIVYKYPNPISPNESLRRD
jgi:Kef-type K+ transport system membrane component KefB